MLALYIAYPDNISYIYIYYINGPTLMCQFNCIDANTYESQRCFDIGLYGRHVSTNARKTNNTNEISTM